MSRICKTCHALIGPENKDSYSRNPTAIRSKKENWCSLGERRQPHKSRAWSPRTWYSPPKKRNLTWLFETSSCRVLAQCSLDVLLKKSFLWNMPQRYQLGNSETILHSADWNQSQNWQSLLLHSWASKGMEGTGIIPREQPVVRHWRQRNWCPGGLVYGVIMVIFVFVLNAMLRLNCPWDEFIVSVHWSQGACSPNACVETPLLLSCSSSTVGWLDL